MVKCVNQTTCFATATPHYYCLESCYAQVGINACFLPPSSGVQCSHVGNCANERVTRERASLICPCGIVLCADCNSLDSIRAKGLRCDRCIAIAPMVAARKAHDAGGFTGSLKRRFGM